MDKQQKFFYEIALKAKERSYLKDPVGGVLVKDDNIVAIGWNGTLPGTNNYCGEGSTVHTCQNLIARAAKAGLSTDGSVVYLTKEPCISCALLLVQAGVSKVVYSGNPNFALNKMSEAGVVIERVLP